MKILLIDDEQQVFNDGKESASVYDKEKIEITFIKSINEDYLSILHDMDFAIVDMKLGADGQAGNVFIEKFNDLSIRVPTVIYTGTPDECDDEKVLKVFRKTESFDTIFDFLVPIYKTGITKILGGRGKLENTLFDVFKKNLLPQISSWTKYAEKDSEKTENALLRYTLNHMQQLLDNDETYLPEEVYICPPINRNIKTGSIIYNNESENYYIVLTPACDLAIRKNGKFKTDKVLLVRLEKYNDVVNRMTAEYKETTGRDWNSKEKTKTAGDLHKNRYSLYFHYLPQAGIFSEDYLINFRDIETIVSNKIGDNFLEPKMQISDSFLKDIISRFSSFYARQGQPDIDFEISNQVDSVCK